MSSPALKHDPGPLPKRLPMPLLGLLATLFAVSAIVYAGTWVYQAFLYLPVTGPGPVSLGLSSRYIAEEHAFLIFRVLPGGPADAAAVKVGDRIVAISGKPVEQSTGGVLLRHTPGDSVELSIRRPGVPELITVHAVFRSVYPAGGAGIVARLSQATSNVFPVSYLIIGLAVLFLRLRDPNAWLMSLIFCGIIAVAPPTVAFNIPLWMRPWLITYRAIFDNLSMPLFYLFFSIFPERSPLDRRAPWLRWFGLTVGAAFALVALRNFGRITTRFGSTSGITEEIRLVFNFAMAILGLVSLVWSVFSATSTAARRKTRVLLWGTLIGVLPITVLVTIDDFRGFGSPLWIWGIVALLLNVFPLSFAYAVVKHRVLEVPVLLRRGARYILVQRGFVLLLIVFSAGITIGFALLFSRYLQAHATAVPGAFALGTLLGTMLLWSGAQLHKDVGRRIDRAFFRSAYDARQVLEDLVEKTRTATDRKELAVLLDRHLKAALQPSSVTVYFETGDDRLSIAVGQAPLECKTLSPADIPLRQLAEGRLPRDVTATGDKLPYPASLLLLRPDCLVPILGRDDRLAGLIVLGVRLSDDPYSSEDKHLLAAVANQTGIALEAIRLGEKVAERIEEERRVAQEMEFARQVQTRLFPQKLPSMRTLEFTGVCSPARTVGGDYYDFLELCPGRLALVLADIAGKGVPGALLMANLQANLRSQYAMAIDNLPQLLASVNRLLHQNTDYASYATMFFADYEDVTGLLRYVNCGHLPALLVRACPSSGGNHAVEWLPSTCTVLGLFEDWQCETAEVRLTPGDTLVIYTDGVTEAANHEGEEFGEKRLLEIVRGTSLSVPQLVENVMAAIRQFSGTTQEDDITLIVAKCSE